MKKVIVILFISLFSTTCFSQIISTFAGTGTVGGLIGDGGIATLAEIANPKGNNFDINGNLLICQSNLVRSINASTNIITSVAGSDTATSFGGGGDGGPATCAGLFAPYAVTIDHMGNLYIADYWYNKVRKVNISTGIIDPYAGTGAVGSTGDGGLALNARFNSIMCVHIDTARRRMYISDGFNYKVRVIDMNTGIISNYGGTGISGYSGDGLLATSAKFSRVLGLCTDKAGNLYIGDWDNARIRKIDITTGIVSTYVGTGTVGYSGDYGSAVSANISKATALCMDSCDNLYFSDEENHVVRRVDATTGQIITVAGNGSAGFSGDGGSSTLAQLNRPTGVKVDNFGHLYISDWNNHRVRKMTYIPPTPTVAVTIAPLPNDTVCAGTAVTYTATATGTAPPTYTWYRNGVVVSTAGSTYTYTPTHADSVRCVATVQVCGVGTAWASSNTIHMVVTPLAMPTISLGGSTAAPLGSTVTVTAMVAGAGSSYSISWYRNGLPLATTTVPLITYTKTAGTDAITARLSSTAPTGCYDTATAASHTVLVGPNEVGNITTQLMAVTVSPNPARTVLRIDGEVHMWRIMGITGAVLLQGGSPAGHNIVVQDLPAGMYYIELWGPTGQRAVQRFLKE